MWQVFRANYTQDSKVAMACQRTLWRPYRKAPGHSIIPRARQIGRPPMVRE